MNHDANRYYNKQSNKESNNEFQRESREDIPVKPLEIVSKIHRFNFTTDFMHELAIFAKIHQYDDRGNYKEAWGEWMDDNEEIINREIQYLNSIEFKGNIIDKMYKSGRYYFRNKSDKKKEAAKRRKYISVSTEFIDAVDNHIEQFNFNDNKPHDGYLDFCKTNTEILKAEIMNLSDNIKDKIEINNKFKKTYKNRHFILTN